MYDGDKLPISAGNILILEKIFATFTFSVPERSAANNSNVKAIRRLPTSLLGHLSRMRDRLMDAANDK